MAKLILENTRDVKVLVERMINKNPVELSVNSSGF